MKNRKDISVPVPEELDEQVCRRLDYGDSKAAWIREAIRMRLEIDDPNPEIGKTIPDRNNADTTAD